MADVAVAHGVFLAFDAHLAGFFDGLFGLELGEVFEGVDFGADEAAFEVGVDDAGGLGGGGADGDWPGADFFFAGGEVGLEAEEFVGAAGNGGESGFFEAEGFEHFFLLGLGHEGEFAFDLGADRDNFAAFFGGVGADALGHGALAVEIVFVDVHDVEDLFGGDEAEVFEGLGLFDVVDHQEAGGLAFVEEGLDLLEGFEAGDFVGLAGLGGAFGLAEGAFDGLEVGEREFGVDDFDVAEGIDGARDV